MTEQTTTETTETTTTQPDGDADPTVHIRPLTNMSITGNEPIETTETTTTTTTTTETEEDDA